MIKWLPFFLWTSFCFGQSKNVALPIQLNELSGLAFINDSILVAHNDGGDQPRLYFLDLQGKLLHSCLIQGSKNIDWEDLAYDGSKYVYIGEIGNNNNNRQDLKIIRVNVFDALKFDSVAGASFNFQYPDQLKYPPAPKDYHYDAEAMAYYDGHLYLFTKCRAEPWDGMSYVYQLDTEMVDQKAKKLSSLYVGKSGWWQDAITGVDIRGDLCYLLTYNRLMVYKIKNGTMDFIGRTYLEPITQKEAIAVNSKGAIVVGDERSKLIGGGFLYLLDYKWDK